ncbi:MAG: YibE/F family protein [Synergistaceae bacterium]|jgi:uncharacterized membrane protein|nr:YibE/F family protein [Synergistaceae bacterium]
MRIGEVNLGGLRIDYGRYLLRFGLAAAVAACVYYAVDTLTLAAWNSDESSVVEIAGASAPVPLADDEESPFNSVSVAITARFLTGPDKGKTEPLIVTQMDNGGVELHTGTRYILFSDVFEDGTAQHSISDVFRVPSVAGVVVFACACLVAFAGAAGARALVGLGLSVLCLLWVYIPFVAAGGSPILPAFGVVAFIAAVTVFCVVRRGRARLVAFLGATGGAAGAFLLGWAMVRLWRLSGLGGDSATLLATTLPGADVRGILLSSVIISAIGAVLDVGVSITAAMSELVEHDQKIAPLDLWMSGIRVGAEVLGSMINTLILAYIGTSMPFAVLISSAGVDLLGLMNDQYVGQEIVQSLAGTSGLLLTIPITATCFVALRSGRS